MSAWLITDANCSSTQLTVKLCPLSYILWLGVDSSRRCCRMSKTPQFTSFYRLCFMCCFMCLFKVYWLILLSHALASDWWLIFAHTISYNPPIDVFVLEKASILGILFSESLCFHWLLSDSLDLFCIHYKSIHYKCIHYKCIHYKSIHYKCIHYKCIHYKSIVHNCGVHTCASMHPALLWYNHTCYSYSSVNITRYVSHYIVGIFVQFFTFLQAHTRVNKKRRREKCILRGEGVLWAKRVLNKKGRAWAELPKTCK